MSVRSVLTTVGGESATPAARPAAAGRGMSRVDAVTVAVISIAVGTMTLIDPTEALWYLLVFPIWILSRDLGLATGAAAAVCALLFGGSVVVRGEAGFGPLDYLACAAVFSGAVAAGAQAGHLHGSGGAKRPSPLLRLLTARPEIIRTPGALSSRELEILERVATGEKNAEIADRFVISQNTVKSHVSQILKKLSVTNRTEAAFRYIELYGRPSVSNGSMATVDDGQEEDTAQIGAASALTATVSAFGRKDRVLLTLEDGRDLEVPLLDEIRGRVEVGASAIVYSDQRERVVGWYLPDHELGVDLRRWAL
jgi:DNA-binding CsgD family transcriptional regulator